MKRLTTISTFLGLLIILFACSSEKKETAKAEITPEKKMMKALIIDGENNHGVWPLTTMMMHDYLKETGLFEVDIQRTANTWQGPHYDKSIGLEDITELLKMYPIPNGKTTIAVEEPVPDSTFSPNFSDYDVVVSNLGWKASTWSDETKQDFEKYMKAGGGLIIIHAANNSWGDWEEYNKMIGVGGWGGRNTASGPYVYYDKEGQLVKDPSEGECGSHGAQAEFVITTRSPEHPIMKGLPTEWMHAKDELYDRMRGPAENITVLATAFSDIERNSPPWNDKVTGTDRHEPMLLTVDYGKGRIFQSMLGHMGYSMECIGFKTTFQRGAEWVASGQVTQAVPANFPTAEKVSQVAWKNRK